MHDAILTAASVFTFWFLWSVSLLSEIWTRTTPHHGLVLLQVVIKEPFKIVNIYYNNHRCIGSHSLRILLQPDREAVSYRGLFTAGWFGVREKHCFRLEIYDRLRASEQTA